MSDLDAEDQKIVTLARGAAARVGAAAGAAVRDDTGRTYSSASVSLGALDLSAVVLAVAQAKSSGAQGLEAVACIGNPSQSDLHAIAALGGSGIPVFVINPSGEVVSTVHS